MKKVILILLSIVLIGAVAGLVVLFSLDRQDDGTEANSIENSDIF